MFSGIEAASQAWHPLGWTCVGVSEIEEFPSAVLAHHHSSVPNLGDVTKITEQDIIALGKIDIVVFGSPCQDLSVAGKGRGFTDDQGNVTRSGLFFTAIQIIEWARKHGDCRFALWENVPGAFSSSQGRDFAAVVDAMAGLEGTQRPPKGWGNEGCAIGEKAMVEWSTLDAQWRGVAQRRRRVFVIADFGDWTSRCPILLESESLRGDTPPSREARKDIAGTIGARTGLSIGAQDAACGHLIPEVSCFDKQRLGEYGSSGVASTCSARDYKDATDLVCIALAGNTIGRTPTNGGNGLRYADSGAAYTLTKTDVHAVVYPINMQIAMRHEAMGDGTGMGIGEDGDVAYTLQAAHSHAVAFKIRGGCEGGGKGYLGSDELAFTLSTHTDQHLHQGMQVRRLTPVECARLQGFPDTHLDITFKNKPAADSHKYRALGNSMAVPVMAWIGSRIQLALNPDDSLA